MSMTSKIEPVKGSSAYSAEITITLDQLRQEAKDFIAHLTVAGISQAGLHFEDFVPVVLRRRMQSFAADAKRLGITCYGAPWMVLDEEIYQGGGPCIRFLFADQTNAAAFKIALL